MYENYITNIRTSFILTKIANQLPLLATYRVMYMYVYHFYINDTPEDGHIAETCSVICVQ
jgi:hypothetical protein